MDMEPFGRINPCGFSGMPMCQLADFVRDVSVPAAGAALVASLSRRLGLAPRDIVHKEDWADAGYT